jgi:hypothetical protein
VAPLTVDGGGDSPGPSSGFVEVDHDGPLHLERRLAVVLFG